MPALGFGNREPTPLVKVLTGRRESPQDDGQADGPAPHGVKRRKAKS
jgi:hypothetical protein